MPFKNPSHHQFRELKSTSETKTLKYTASTSALRIKEGLERETLNYLTTSKSTNRKIDQIIKNQAKQLNNKTLSKIVNKSLLPNLHQKTHFHSIKTIYSESPCGFLKMSTPGVGLNGSGDKENLAHEVYEDETEIEAKKEQEKGSNDYANRKENSKEALVKCGLLKTLNKDFMNSGRNYSKSKMSTNGIGNRNGVNHYRA